MPQFSIDQLKEGIRLENGYDPVAIIRSLEQQIRTNHPGKTIWIYQGSTGNGSGNTIDAWLNGSHPASFSPGDHLKIDN